MILIEAIGLGLVTSLLFSELLALTAGGLVVPGYVAAHLHEPLRIVATLLAGIVGMVIVRIIGRFVLLYGRRTMVISVLAGYLISILVHSLLRVNIQGMTVGSDLLQQGLVVGYIISGLIAYWMVRQGVVETVCTILMSSIIVRLVLIIIHGGDLGSAAGMML
jgi:gamma-polyglutamate biosynthesis protein CapC